MRSVLLEVEGLHVHYDRISALKGVDISVAEGEIVAILGANGAGKTTLMRTLAGLEAVHRGEILFLEKSVVGVPAHRRSAIGISLVPEGRSVFAPLTVAQNLRLGLLPKGYRRARSRLAERIPAIVEIFPVLKDRMQVRGGELSGGQQQMLAIARALMCEPKLLLLDEPSLGLAPLVVEDVFRSLLDLKERQGVTIVLCEQNIDNALAIADRAYVFDVGRVAIADTAEKLRGRAEIEDVYLGRHIGQR